MITSRFAKCAVAVGAIGLAAVLPSNVQAADALATATVAAALTLAKDADMSFGKISETGAGTIILALDGSRTVTGGASILVSGPGAAAQFTVNGEADATYDINLPTADVTLGGPGADMIIAFGTFNRTPGAGTLPSAPCPCEEVFFVGATLPIAAGQTPGGYTTGAPGFSVTVNYN